MPNWCGNYIKISGEESNMKTIYDFFTKAEAKPDEDIWVMSTLVPEDDEFNRIKESGEFLLSPYVEFYGCKWDFRVNESQCDIISPSQIILSPATAWSPPLPFCQKLSEKYNVDVSIEFYESGNDMAGFFHYSNGEEIEAEDYAYMEGMFYLDNETFWYELESEMEWLACESPDREVSELIATRYPYITNEDDIISFTEIYNEYKGSETTEE